MKDGRCNVHYRGLRCENSWHHTGRKHRFLLDGEYVWRTREEIAEWLSARKECSSPGKVSFQQEHKARLHAFRQELITGREFRAYLCECGNFHIFEEYYSAKATIREARGE